jgi:hypothetical protein
MCEQIRRPDPIAVSITAYEKHVRRHPLVWLVRKQADR